MATFVVKNVVSPRSIYAKQLMCRPGLRKARVRCFEDREGRTTDPTYRRKTLLRRDGEL